MVEEEVKDDEDEEDKDELDDEDDDEDTDEVDDVEEEDDNAEELEDGVDNLAREMFAKVVRPQFGSTSKARLLICVKRFRCCWMWLAMRALVCIGTNEDFLFFNGSCFSIAVCMIFLQFPKGNDCLL